MVVRSLYKHKRDLESLYNVVYYKKNLLTFPINYLLCFFLSHFFTSYSHIWQLFQIDTSVSSQNGLVIAPNVLANLINQINQYCHFFRLYYSDIT